MRSWWARGWRDWSPPRSWPTPDGGCCCSTRSPRRTSAARPSGRSAACSWSTRPEQRRMGIRDSARARLAGLARQRGLRPRIDDPAGEDYWARRWAQAYVDFAAGEKRSWLHGMGVRLLPARRLGRARRLPGRRARQLGAALPRHVGHRARRGRAVRAAGPGGGGCGPGRAAVPAPGGRADRHRRDGGRRARRGPRAQPAPRAAPRSSRVEAGEFELRAQAVVVTSGGIGGNHDLVRANWPERLGAAAGAHDLRACPSTSTAGCSAIAEAAGGRLVNRDRMWHYTEGIQNWDPIWAGHGIRILPGPSSLWFDARGRRLPGAALPRLRHARHAGGTSGPPATTTRGSCSPRRSSRRSSRCRARSRTPT